jgi:hypothetical protein
MHAGHLHSVRPSWTPPHGLPRRLYLVDGPTLYDARRGLCLDGDDDGPTFIGGAFSVGRGVAHQEARAPPHPQ